jgi:hypothetical protein
LLLPHFFHIRVDKQYLCSQVNDVKTLVATNDPNFLSQLQAIDEVVRLVGAEGELGEESKAA